MQAEVCRGTHTPEGRAFIQGAKGARSVALDACKPQPITADRRRPRVQLGAGSAISAPRGRRGSAMYEARHGALVGAGQQSGSRRPRLVLAACRSAGGAGRYAEGDGAGAARARSAGEAGSRRRRARARRPCARAVRPGADARGALRGVPSVDLAHIGPAVLDATAADALMRVALADDDDRAGARGGREGAEQRRPPWVMLARCLGSRSGTTSRRSRRRPRRARARRRADADLLRRPGDGARGAPPARGTPPRSPRTIRFRSPDNVRGPPDHPARRTRRSASASASRRTRTCCIRCH